MSGTFMVRSSGWVGVTAVAASLLLAGCAGARERDSGPAASGASAGTSAGTSSVRALAADCPEICTLLHGVGYDYDPVESPRALAGIVDLAVVGRIGQVRQGRAIGADDPLPHVVVTVSVDRVLRGKPGLVTDGNVYVELPVVGGTSLADYRRALPAGSRIAAFLFDYTTPGGDMPIRDQGAGRPAGTRLFAPHPQGFLVEIGGVLDGGFETLATQGPGWRTLTTVDQVESAAR